MKGKLFLVPNYIAPSNDKKSISSLVLETVANTQYFLVENVRTARRFISSLDLGIDISQLIFHEMDKKFDTTKLDDLMQPIKDGHDIVVISEAGMPCIADPGKEAVRYAHRNGIEVVAIQGTSSILLGLISSGLDGQKFTFHGYLPIDKKEQIDVVKKIQLESQRTGYTQIFMEAPYRNDRLFDTLIRHLDPNTHLFVGANISGTDQMVRTLTVREWQNQKPKLHKIPTIFGLGSWS